MPYYTPPPTGNPYENMPFTIEAINNCSVQFYSNNASNIKYNKNNGQATGYCGSSISLNAGDTISFEGTNYLNGKVAYFSSTNSIKMYGNIASLIGYSDTLPASGFRGMFSGNANIIDTSNLIFPFQTIKEWGCHKMFSNCINLVSPPTFKTSIIEHNACEQMFSICSALTAMSYIPFISAAGGAFAAIHYSSKDGPLWNCDWKWFDNAIVSNQTIRGICYDTNKIARPPIFGKLTFVDTGIGQGGSNSSYGPFLQTFGYNNGKLSCMEVQFTSWYGGSTPLVNAWMNGAPSQGIFIKPPELSKDFIKSGWTVLNRDSNHKLWNTDSNGNSTTQYTGDDPYAAYYNSL